MNAMPDDKFVPTTMVSASELRAGDIVRRGSRNQFRVRITSMDGDGVLSGIIGMGIESGMVWTFDRTDTVAKEKPCG